MNAHIHIGDASEVLGTMPADHFAACVTSPPYFGLIDYIGGDRELGGEASVSEYVDRLCRVFAEVNRVLLPDGILWLVIGDTYNSYAGTAGPGSTKKFLARNKIARRKRFAGLRDKAAKPKDLLGVPWRVASALRDAGWYLRAEIIWRKPGSAPEPAAVDRPYRQHETVFLLSKSMRYAWQANEPCWSVWDVGRAGRTKHPADFPPRLVEECLRHSPEGPVLDPFAGSGTVGLVADRMNRDFVGVELNPDYARLAHDRIAKDCPMFSCVSLYSTYTESVHRSAIKRQEAEK